MNRMRKITNGLLGAVLALALLLPLGGAVVPEAQAEEDTGAKLLAITFDDGPSQYTNELLDGLKARGAKATFFMCGVNGGNGTVKHRAEMERMLAEGHQLANHTWSHAAFGRLGAAKIKSEVAAVEEALFDVVGGAYMDLVRTPGGANNATIRANVGHPVITWRLDPMDWRDRNEDTVYNRIVERAKDGDVILLHDLYLTSVRGGLRAIDTLQQQGYEFVTVSELFRRRGVYLENGVFYNSAPNKGINRPGYSAPKLSVSYNAAGDTLVSVTGLESWMDVRYTLDGSAPTLRSPKYTGPITLKETATVSAAGFDRFATRTPVASEEIAGNVCAQPVLTSAEGGTLTFTTATPGASVYYTTDGSNPVSSGVPASGAIEAGLITRVIARASGRIDSPELTVTRAADGSYFTDVPIDHHDYLPISRAHEAGFMNGVADFVFAPGGATTRAQLVSILYRMAGEPAVDLSGLETRFSDVKAGDWCAAAVEWAAANGVVNGVDGRFLPTAGLKREQAAAILTRYAASLGLDTAAGDLGAYPDADKVSEYARDAFAWCLSEGLLEAQSGALRPADIATRGQMARMITALSAAADAEGGENA